MQKFPVANPAFLETSQPNAPPPFSRRSLKTVAAAQGFNRSRFEVFTPAPHPELSEFLRLVGLPLTVTHEDSEFVATLITKQFVFMIEFVLRKYKDADLLIFLEEDVSVSPDFFMSVVIGLLFFSFLQLCLSLFVSILFSCCLLLLLFYRFFSMLVLSL